MKKIFCLIVYFFYLATFCQEKPVRWQQQVDYKMVVDVDVEKHTYEGTQRLVYKNNSPDELSRVFYHLYFNAFKPGTDLEQNSRNSVDDSRSMSEKLLTIPEEDWGDVQIKSLLQDGVSVNFKVEETILIVDLAKPIVPGKKTVLEMGFFIQTPAMIRRSGKESEDNVAFSMSQWYPKICQYDDEGWHANPYIGREFYGVWGNFDVTINIDKDYTVAGSGYLQNPELIGHGYAPLKKGLIQGDKISWRFLAHDVHDFSWAADPHFIHDFIDIKNGPRMHFFYKSDSDYVELWKDFQQNSAEFLRFFSKTIGKYPYDQYSIIMAGDGGMEYAMCTFIDGVGHPTIESLYSVTSHEIAHTWFQFLMATNESKHAWMDEGFTSYIDDVALNVVLNHGKALPNANAYQDYFKWVASGLEEPMTTHADRFKYNSGYGMSSYDKGSIFLSQLEYVIGKVNFDNTLKKYFKDWSFKHPKPNDFLRCAEKISGLELDWYLLDWTQSTMTIDYAISSVEEDSKKTKILLRRIGQMGMPIDIKIFLKSGKSIMYNIPLTKMRGSKPVKNFTLLDSWSWAKPEYGFYIDVSKSDVSKIIIDPEGKMADVNRTNNIVIF
ncbi:MAG: peptidase M1 [Flavobacteriaceae bacterium]|nr:peptidase M1 [Flavobacteriaceae bacterium]|tara:strand:- start:1254 stop:3074 length:1821 start_codon:yes stop_codon:yes gene_type:complete